MFFWGIVAKSAIPSFHDLSKMQKKLLKHSKKIITLVGGYKVFKYLWGHHSFELGSLIYKKTCKLFFELSKIQKMPAKRMQSRQRILLDLYSEVSSPAEKNFIYQNLLLLNSVAQKLVEFDNYSVQKLPEEMKSLDWINQSVCFLGSASELQALKNLLKVLAELLSFPFLVIDCASLHEGLFNCYKQNQQTTYAAGFFTQLFLKMPSPDTIIFFDNIDKISNEFIKQCFYKFLKKRRTFIDPCINSQLYFSSAKLICVAPKEKKCLVESSFSGSLQLQNISSILRSKDQIYTYFLQQELDCLGLEEAFCQLEQQLIKPCMVDYMTKADCLQFDLANFQGPEDVKLALCRDIQALQSEGSFCHESFVQHFKSLLRLSSLSFCLDSDQFSFCEFKKLLDKNIFGQNLVKEEIINFVAFNKIVQKGSGRSLLLTGPPGVGKTSFAKVLAEALNRPLFIISCGSILISSQLKGWPRSYSHAKEGMFAQALLSTGCKNPIILIDEVDKSFSSQDNFSILAAFLEVLDSVQNSRVFDNYLETWIDFSQCLFLLTANDESKIPKPLLDRFQKINLAGFSAEEKFVAAKDFLLPKILKNIQPKYLTKINISDDQILELVKQDQSCGLRCLSRALERLITDLIRPQFFD